MFLSLLLFLSLASAQAPLSSLRSQEPSQHFVWPSAHSVSGQAEGPSPTTAPGTSTAAEPCASVLGALSSSSAGAVPTIPAELAYNCQKSVPFDKDAAKPWLETLRPYIFWQTTTAYLKNPPSGYLEPAVDVYGALDNLISQASAGSYSNEYDFEFDIYRKVFQETHDGHFRYTPSLIGGVFAYGRTIPLVSVSEDGKALPEAYVYADILAQSMNGTKASAVKMIDGQDVVTFLQNVSQYGSLQDPDALYNNVFYELAQISLGSTGTGTGIFGGGGRGAYIYPGPSTNLTFANGTSSTYPNFARVLVDFTGINNGKDLYDKYLNPPPSSTTTSATSTATPTSTPAPGYPNPVIRQENNLIGGYYLNGTGYDDVAVLSVPSFVGDGNAEQSFQDVGYNFLKQSKADGKKKLIIDVSANGGGTVSQGYNLFTELFPQLVPYGAQRFRAHEGVDIMGQEVSNVSGPVYPWDVNAPNNTVLDNFLGTPFDYRSDLNVSLGNFTSWPDKYGPHEFYGDNFSSIIRYDLNDIYITGITVTGYGDRKGLVTEQWFQTEDIIIVYDGYCASTCTIFSELMRQQGKVKTIALGGQPKEGIIQAVGGVKGVNDYPWDLIYDLVNSTFELGTPEQQQEWVTTELGQYSDYPFRRATNNYAVNFRDGLREGDTTQTPLQFVYEPADCRIYYTADMTVDVTAIWKTVADSVWNGKSACVAGDVTAASKRDVKRGRYRGLARRAAPVQPNALFESIHNTFTDLRGKGKIGNSFMTPN